jgi:AAA family ATP:ADP antiporter
VNIITLLIQAFLVSRIVKYLGMRGVLFALPIVAFGAYGLIAYGAGFAVIRVLKMAENSTDYSVMNTAKALLWLTTSREEKYKAKQAVDTFFYRFGDVLSAGFVFIGTTMLHLEIKGFALFNCSFIIIWFGILIFLLKQYNKLSNQVTDH